MTDRAPERAADPARAANLRLLRQSLVVLGAVALVVVVVAAAVLGWGGLVGALLGTALVLAFFGVDVAVFLRPVPIGPPTATVVVMLYVAKLVAFGFLVVALVSFVDFDHGAFALAVVVEALTAAALAMRAFARMRLPYVAP